MWTQFLCSPWGQSSPTLRAQSLGVYSTPVNASRQFNTWRRCLRKMCSEAAQQSSSWSYTSYVQIVDTSMTQVHHTLPNAWFAVLAEANCRRSWIVRPECKSLCWRNGLLTKFIKDCHLVVLQIVGMFSTVKISMMFLKQQQVIGCLVFANDINTSVAAVVGFIATQDLHRDYDIMGSTDAYQAAQRYVMAIDGINEGERTILRDARIGLFRIPPVPPHLALPFDQISRYNAMWHVLADAGINVITTMCRGHSMAP